MTKKLLSILLAVLMVMTYVTPAMALPLDMNPLEDVVEGGEVTAPVEEPAEPHAPGGLDKSKTITIKAPVCACGSDACDVAVEVWRNGVKEATLTKGSADYGTATSQKKPVTLKAVNGTCGHEFTKWTMTGDSTAYGTKVNNAEFVIKYATSIQLGATYTANFQTAAAPSTYTVTYTDGVDGEEIFADQTYTVEENKATPAFNGEPTREGYEFAGWQPEVAATVTADVTYTAQWKVESNNVARLESTGAEYDTLQKALNAAKSEMKNGAQTVTLLKDVNESVTVDWMGSVGLSYNYDLTIDLNGKTVTGKSGSVFTFKRTQNHSDSMMNVTFNDSVGTGVVTGGNATNGGAINFDSQYGCAKLVINGGKFTGNTASNQGGAICAKFAKGTTSVQKTIEVVLAGGEITGNNAKEGGGIVVWNNISVVNQTGCKIYNNTATSAGDDVVYRANVSPSNAKMSLAENAWFVDNSGARYDAAKPVPFTKWANYTGSGATAAVYLKYVEPTYFTVTYTDGVDGEEVFADDVHNVLAGEATPAFVGGTPTRKDYKFLGWDPEVAEKVTENATYTAKWEQVYTVTYTDGAEGAVFADQVYEVKPGDATPAFVGSTTREGYKFLGWQPEVAETVTESVVYTAQWEAIKYKLTFNGNGTNKLSGTISGSHTSKTKYTAGTNVNLKTAMDGKKFTKELSADYSTNYRQTGWNTKKDGTGDHYAMNGTFVMPASDVTLYAEWESYEWIHWNVQMSEGGDHINYTTKYMGPKADVQSFKAYTGNVGTGAGKVPAAYYTPVKAFAKEGYRFIGWYDVAKNECISTNESLYVKDFRNLRALKLAESGAVLEARFEAKKASNIHVVIYKASDLTKPVVSKAVTNLYDGDTFTPNIADYYSSANGYEFVGWFNDGNFNQYKAGKNYTEATEFTVTGAWQNVIAVVTDYEKVVVKAVYDGDKANAKTVYSGLALRGTNVIEYLEANAGVGEVEGYALDKWYNWDWYGHKVAENATVNGWTNVYVTYTRNIFTVTYTDGVNGAAFADESHTAKYEDATPAFEGSLENYIGWVFNGWNPKVANKVTEDVTYTAKWRMKGANTVIYYGNEGIRTNGDTFWSEYTNAQTKVLGSNTGYYEFARTGWHFTGWNTKADGTGDAYAAGATYTFTAAHNLETVKLYAQWERNTYTVSFNCNGGEACAPITVTYGEAYGRQLPACFVDGMQNLGWYLVDAEGNVTDISIGERTLVTEARDHQLFQKREIKTPTVKLNLSRPVYNYLEKPVTIQSSGITEYPALKYSYQWYKDGTALTDGKIYEGSNTANLTLKHDYVSCSGLYKLVVTISVADNSGIVSANGTVTAEAKYDLLIRRSSNMVIYDANGGQGGPLNDSDYYDKANDRYIAKLRGVDAIPNSPLVRQGYHFLGWNTKADGSGDSYKPGDFYVFDRELSENGGLRVTLYAMWEANTYTVSFNCNGGEACAPITVTYGEAYGRQLPACFVDGMQNLGWYLVDAEGNVTDISIGERTLVTEARDHQLFQKREIKTPTVKLNLSRPVYNYLEKPVTIQSSGITEYPALKYSYQWYKDGTALTDGKIYEGSNTANLTLKHDYVSCSGLYKLVVTISVADNSGIVSANGTVTAEAKYDLLIRRSSNMVIYDANGGQGGPLNDSDYYDKANDRYIAKLRGVDAIPNSPLVRQGYHFLGWNTKADGSGDSYKPGDFYVFDRELSENGGLRVTLYAMWEACADHLVGVKVLKAPTCTEKGLKLCRCKVCGVEYEVEMPALGHDLSGWIWNRTEHWKKCRRCGELLEVDKHILTEWKDILRNGEIVPEHHCVVCGFSECGSVIHIDGTKKPQAGVEVNPPTGAEVPSLLPALAVLAGAAVLLRKKK